MRDSASSMSRMRSLAKLRPEVRRSMASLLGREFRAVSSFVSSGLIFPETRPRNSAKLRSRDAVVCEKSQDVEPSSFSTRGMGSLAVQPARLSQQGETDFAQTSPRLPRALRCRGRRRNGTRMRISSVRACPRRVADV